MSTSPQPDLAGVLRVLLLEDDPRDAELLLYTLRKTGLSVSADVCGTFADFKALVAAQPYAVLFGDYALPDSDGLHVIQWLRESGVKTPFILVTGALGDEMAIECIKAGADDYVLKHNLRRLPMVLQRTLAEQQLRFERDWAERELRESEYQYRLMFEANPHPMWVCDRETRRFLAANEAALRHYGYSVAEFLAMKLDDIQARQGLAELLQYFLPNVIREEHRLCKQKTKNGSVIDVEISFGSIVFRGVEAVLLLASDVTAQRRLEKRLLDSQKMEAIGRLAGGVAHDFNNLLMVVSSHAELWHEFGPREAKTDNYFHQIMGAVEKGSLLTRHLLAFSRRQAQAPQLLDLNTLIAEFSGMLPPLLGEDIRLTVQTASHPCFINSDRAQIEQVLMNLVVNGRDAMPKGGTLTIQSDELELPPSYFGGRDVEAKPGAYVVLSVSDTGIGMDSNTQSHAFEPFFTTKEPGKGTGLGLSTVYGIVKQNGGFVWLCSEVGAGTTVKVYLPAYTGKPQAESLPSAAQNHACGTETILLVEDEPGIREGTSQLLQSRGYRVLPACNSEQALEISKYHEGTIQLLLTDIVMPGESGPELAQRLMQSRPGIRVLFMSGYARDPAGLGTITQGTFYIQKPFTASALCSAIRRALESGENGGAHDLHEISATPTQNR